MIAELSSTDTRQRATTASLIYVVPSDLVEIRRGRDSEFAMHHASTFWIILGTYSYKQRH